MAKKAVSKKDLSRLRSEVRQTQEEVKKVRKDFAITKKEINPFTGFVSGNYWTQTGMPWVSSEGRKAVLTEWFWQPIRGQPRRVDTNELRQFSQTFWVHSCVKTIMDEVSSLDWDILPKDEYDYGAMEGAILSVKEFLKYPNKNRESFMEVMRAAIKDILELDAGVLVKVFDLDSYDFTMLEPKSGSPLLKPLGQRRMVEIYARDGSSFLKEVDKFGFVRGYWQYSYQIPAHPMWFDRDEIVYLTQHQRSMSTYGYAVTQAIMDIIKSLHYSTIYNKRYFEETPIPDGALSLLDTNETEMKAFMDYWNNEFKGQPHKLAVVNKDVKWNPFNISNRELEFLETQKWYYKMVITSFGLTPSEVGLTDDLNRATSATQSEVTKRKAIRPMLRLIESFVNEHILPEFGEDGIQFQFIVDDPSEKMSRLNNWKMELDMGLKTINDIRIEEGLAPVAWGEMPTNLRPILQPESTQEATHEGEENLGEGGLGEESPGEEQAEIIEEGQSQGYEQERRRAEASEEAHNEAMQPFSTGNRPVGSFRSASTSLNKATVGQNMASMDLFGRKYDELSSEEKRKADELVEQDRQDRAEIGSAFGRHDRIKKKSKFFEEVDKVLNTAKQTMSPLSGQYYYELVGNAQPPSTGYYEPHEDVTLISDNRHPEINPTSYANPQQQWIEGMSEIQCPRCGIPALGAGTSADDIGRVKQYRCQNCGEMIEEQELIDNQVLHNFITTLQSNPINETNFPRPIWSPKSATLEKTHLEMSVKEFVGFDYEKTLNDSMKYVISAKYQKIIDKYFSDLSKKQQEKLKLALVEGIKKHETMKDITARLDKILKDPQRSEIVALTETARILNVGSVESYQDKGFKKGTWITAPDERVCEVCAPRDGKEYELGWIKRHLPAHPRCRCTFG